MAEKIILFTELPGLKLYKRGKVRDVYDLGDKLLIVSTDRISAFDVVLPCGIPFKGKVLNSISCFWFEFLKGTIAHHLISADIGQYPEHLLKYKDQLSGRSMLVKKTKPFAVECVVRGYLSGSGWKEYQRTQSVCGIKLPAGLKESDKLPQIIFTPSTKEDTGHDINVTQDYVEKLIGQDTAEKLKEISIAVYRKAGEYACEKGIIIADTKFEFGVMDGRITLIDEVLTPDSSRFWPKEQYSPGKPQPSFDKQFVRDYLESLDWDKKAPAPALPEDIIRKTSQKYLDAYHKLTGNTLPA
ncbi:MAG: phosphoribosylaminoimidazolesuccinocarboxamide synthase [Candidatus Omnitrophica bacterium]|nr:phosphoribosylaminoimidazolesuccinocarboxamide synthase [Candidatus Omnitrophota bacterium]